VSCPSPWAQALPVLPILPAAGGGIQVQCSTLNCKEQRVTPTPQSSEGIEVVTAS
jgi:hypothetical protein